VALNVNIPAIPPEAVKGYKLTRQRLAKMREYFEEREDPRGNRYYWLSGEIPIEESDDSLDATALSDGFVSITPLFYDLTAHSHLQDLASALKNLT
jgi:5'-nucleotidase